MYMWTRCMTSGKGPRNVVIKLEKNMKRTYSQFALLFETLVKVIFLIRRFSSTTYGKA